MKYKISLLSSVISASLLSGCGFEVEKNVIEPLPPALQGQFVDSPVSGLEFERKNIDDEIVASGTTDLNGHFEYLRGDRIVFKIGENFKLPEISPKNFVTPLSFFKTDNPVAPQVANLARLLQSLDTDGDPENGIEITPNAASVANMPLNDGETVEAFFNRSPEDFAAAIEPWLTQAIPDRTMVSYDDAVAHFVKTLEEDFGDVASGAFDLSVFDGEIYNPFIDNTAQVVEQKITFTPDPVSEDGVEGKKGSYIISVAGSDVQTGTYEFVFGRRVLAMHYMDGEHSKTQYLVSLGYNTQTQVYSVCAADDSMGVASIVANCDIENERNINKIAFSAQQNTVEIEALNQAAQELSIELKEDFDTDIDSFFSSTYKRLDKSLSSGPLYAIASGSPEIIDGQFKFDGDRITIGDTSGAATNALSSGTGIYNLSEGFSISFDVISASDAGNFYIYADNNTASQSNSLHGDISKMVQIDLATGETTEGGLVTLGASLPTFKVGERVTYSYQGDAFAKTKNSFIQLRAAGDSIVVIDNLQIDTIAASVGAPEEPTEPEGPKESEVSVDLPFVFDFTSVSGDLFSSETLALDGTVDASGSAQPMFYKTGGTIDVSDTGVKLSGARFTIGNSETLYSTSSSDNTKVGVFDLSKPYNIVLDVVQTQEPTAGKKFQVYIDNNTSGSANSMHGGSSRIYNVAASSVPLGELVIPGEIGTNKSFVQLRTEGDSVVEIKNLRIEYLNPFEAPVFSCSDAGSEIYYCDDFADGNLDDWNLDTGSDDGAFDVLELENGNKVMRFTAEKVGGVLATLKDSVMANIPSADYFVEMKIRPRQNSTTSKKHLYILGRYQDEDNWYGAGLNMQNASTSTQAEVATKLGGSLNRPVQTKKPFLLGEKGATEDGVWYTVRYEVLGSDITLYVDGEKIGTHTDSSLTAKGLVGLYTDNRSFEIDDLKIGDASVKPVLLTTDLAETNWTGSALGDALVFKVTAQQKDGVTTDSFTAESSDVSVAKVERNGDTVTVTPLKEGTATLYLTAGSDASVIREIYLDIGPAFSESGTDYGDLAAKLSPMPGAQAQYIDSSFTIKFDSEPVLGTSGVVRIFDTATSEMVDEISVSSDTTSLGKTVASITGKTRDLNYRPFTINGNKLTIKPADGVLEYGKTYQLVVGNDVVVNTQLNARDFDGIGSGANWTFTTKASAPSGTEVIVDDDGFADFRTLQGALNYAMTDKNTAMTITIKDGIYQELLFLRNKNNLTIQGESRDNTIVQYNNFDGFNSGSSGRPVFLVESSDNLVLNNFTLKNTHTRTGSGDQAETLYFNSSHRLIANNMNFISEQDTLLMKGYNWFYDCLIAGNVDFIWGYSVATLFENSEIRTIGDSKSAPAASNGGYVLQARIQDASYPGFVFINNEFTSGPGPLGNGVNDNSTYIARSAGDGNLYDNIVLINNKLGPHIITDGWRTDPMPNPQTADATSGWREYGSMDLQGNPIDTSGRVNNAIAENDLTNAPYATRADVFASYDNGAGWDPQPIAPPVIADDVQEQGDGGFAGIEGEITGGVGGTIVSVNNGADLIQAISDAKNSGVPLTVYVHGKITSANSNDAKSIAIKDIKDVSIIGVGTTAELEGIGIQIERAENIIIRNLTIHDVPAANGDAIGIEGDENTPTKRIWIDHNELYGDLSVGKNDYDGLLDSKAGATHITVSYNYIHNHYKSMLNGSSDDDTGERFITYHHNHFANLESRVPLFRYGKGHLYNNYFNNISSTAINSRMGAELLIENNVFENVQNPIVSFYSRDIGYWNARNNQFTNVTWTTPDADEASYNLDGPTTSTYEVPYDYQDHLTDTADVKNYVLANAGVGIIDQSMDDIPAIDGGTNNGGNNGGSNGGSNDGNSGGSAGSAGALTEDFSAADRATFFSAAYKTLATDDTQALYIRTGGNVDPVNGELVIDGGRFTIGDTGTATTEAGVDPLGTLDLSLGATLSFKLIAALGEEKGFFVYLDNNTSGSGNSLHGGASKITIGTQSELAQKVGETILVDIPAGTKTSFLQLRTESNFAVTIDDLVIIPKRNDITEDFSAADQSTFFSADYRSLPDDSASPFYVRTGGGVEPINGTLAIGGSSGGRFTIGDIDAALDIDTADGVEPNGVLDLSNGATVSFKLLDAQGEEKGFFVYIDNNTSSSGKSLHGSASKISVGKLSELTSLIGQTITVDVPMGTAKSFIQLRTESNLTITIDDLVISPK
ncbi:pectinesterase family protein [Catenovulum sediminis]|uniref:Pectinesterase family protein n=1 Tax=Catenovulum sediminis TaxID=1740262 RepID=A0ABV1RJC9_9ALTE|nr:pectinesterase family protein [Catenovulum sediminis]